MREITAFIIMCVIVLWSFARGYRLWKQGRFLSSVFFTVVGSYSLTFVIKQLGVWL